MIVTTATEVSHEPGPHTQTVLAYCETLEAIVSGAAIKTDDWAPLKAYIAVDEFKRVGAYLETFSWQEYIDFLTQWAGGTNFETTLFRISEIGDSVFQEIEERHYKGATFIRKNVIAVYRFNADGKIRHLDIYEQARDSGQWIVEAARNSETAGA